MKVEEIDGKDIFISATGKFIVVDKVPGTAATAKPQPASPERVAQVSVPAGRTEEQNYSFWVTGLFCICLLRDFARQEEA